MPVLKIKKNDSWVEVWGAAGNVANGPVLSSVTVIAKNWVGDGSPYYQTVQIDGANENSKVDLHPTPEQIEELRNSCVSLMAVNDGGHITIYAIGDKPLADYTLSVLITDITV